MALSLTEFKDVVRGRKWHQRQPTEPCCICGGNEWRYVNSMVIQGALYIALACAVCPPNLLQLGGPLIGPIYEEVPSA